MRSPETGSQSALRTRWVMIDRRLPFAALVVAGLAFAPVAQAQRHHGGHPGWHRGVHGGSHGGHRGGNASAAILGGLIGLGLGAAITGSSQPYYPPPAYYPAPGYYAPLAPGY